MPSIHISDPAWQTTFPFLVAPYEDEWLTGLLLRCDEANHWGVERRLLISSAWTRNPQNSI
jgi:hypothetical protein